MDHKMRTLVWVAGIGMMVFAAVWAARAADTPAPPRTARKSAPRSQPAEDPSLPRVLILGDSISIGYTPIVRDLLKGKANVVRPADNCESTKHGLAKLDVWLGKGKWDVIHFNFGLHDLKYINAKGTIAPVDKGKQQVPLEEYEQNLRTIVQRLQQTKAKLIWCSTTPVPAGQVGRIPGDEVKYNQAAATVMKDAGVEVDDLYTFAADKLKDIQQPKNVHFTNAGYHKLAEVVVESIQRQLKK